MNGIESLCAAIFLAGWLLAMRRSWKHSTRPAVAMNSVAIGMLVLAVMLSIRETCQFLTIDETGLASSVANDSPFLIGQWMQSAFHTTTALLLPCAKLARHFGIADSVLLPVLKALHWLMSAAILATIARLCAATFEDTQQRATGEALLLAILLVLPIDQLAMKVFNYDAIALFGGVLGVLLGARALRDLDVGIAKIAVVVATLAACEKLSASPLLLVVILGYALIGARANASRPWFGGMRAAGIAMAISIGCSFALTAIYGAITVNRLPEHYWATTLDPLGSWLSLSALFLFKSQSPIDWHFTLGIATLPILAAAAAVLIWLDQRQRLSRVLDSRIRGLPLLLVLVLIAGISGALKVQAYWAPMAPTSIPQLQHAFALNGIVMHFGAQTLTMHYLAYLAYCAAIIVCATPTVLWLGAAASSGEMKAGKPVPGLDLLVVLGLLLTLVAVATGVPVGQKYLGVAILPICLYLGVALACFAITADSWRHRHGLVSLIFFGLFVELLPFGPFAATFRPIWLNYKDVVPQPGVLNPSWPGWGEELMQAGKELDARCSASPDRRLANVPCAQLRVHTLYPGVWLHTSLIQSDSQGAFPNAALSTSADYYVLNRSSVIQKYVPFPNIPPEFVIAARGYPMAWVYRGDRLAQAKTVGP